MSPGRLVRRRATAARAGVTALGVCAMLGLAWPGRADAFVQYKATTGVRYHWGTTCVNVTVYPNDLLTDMTFDEIAVATTKAAATWSGGENACTYLQLQVATSTSGTPLARRDFRNVIVFRTTSWCKSSDPVGTCYDPAALAITSVFASTKDGRIQDGDIEVNARYFSWTNLDDHPAARDSQDLQNALTHEMGHLIGLDHTCYLPGSLPNDGAGNPIIPTDDQGLPIPDCEHASAEVQATTMFASAPPGDVQKRTLAPDDQKAVCSIYPLALDPMVCPLPGSSSSSGCALSGAPAPGHRGPGQVAALAGTLALALATWRARGRRRRG
jgi:hypothetical protein